MAGAGGKPGWPPPEETSQLTITSSGSITVVEPAVKLQKKTTAQSPMGRCVVTADPETPSPIRVLKRREVLPRQEALAQLEIQEMRLKVQRAEIDEELAASSSAKKSQSAVKSSKAVPVLTMSQIEAFNATGVDAVAFNVERLQQSLVNTQEQEEEETPATDQGLQEFLSSAACAPALADPYAAETPAVSVAYGKAPTDDWCLFRKPRQMEMIPNAPAGSHGAPAAPIIASAPSAASGEPAAASLESPATKYEARFVMRGNAVHGIDEKQLFQEIRKGASSCSSNIQEVDRFNIH